MMKSVLTADIVLSRQIPPALLQKRLSDIAGKLEDKFFEGSTIFEFFRGDSFQGILPAESALKILLLWKAGIKSIETEGRQWDVRLAAGIGAIAYESEKPGASGGPVFEYSGLLLDELKKKDAAGMGIRTFSADWNRQLETECLLADAIIQRWTPAMAETVFHQLLYEETQEQLAERLGIAQPAVNKRLNSANWNAIRSWEQYFQQQVLSYSKTDMQ